MVYNINGIEIDSKLINKYCESLVNKIYAVLAIYEDCVDINDFETFYNYLKRVISELAGGYYIIGNNNFLSLTNILTGILNDTELNHKKVKSLTFHCISIVKKMEV